MSSNTRSRNVKQQQKQKQKQGEAEGASRDRQHHQPQLRCWPRSRADAALAQQGDGALSVLLMPAMLLLVQLMLQVCRRAILRNSKFKAQPRYIGPWTTKRRAAYLNITARIRVHPGAAWCFTAPQQMGRWAAAHHKVVEIVVEAVEHPEPAGKQPGRQASRLSGKGRGTKCKGVLSWVCQGVTQGKASRLGRGQPPGHQPATRGPAKGRGCHLRREGPTMQACAACCPRTT